MAYLCISFHGISLRLVERLVVEMTTFFFSPRFSHVRNDDNDTFVHRSNNPNNNCKTQLKALSYSYDIHLLFVEWSVCLYHQGQIANGHYMSHLGSLSYLPPSIYLQDLRTGLCCLDGICYGKYLTYYALYVVVLLVCHVRHHFV